MSRGEGRDGAKPTRFEIRIKGQLEPRWFRWFGMEVTQVPEANVTLLTGELLDQPALHGILAKIRDLGLSIVSVRDLDSDTSSEPER